MDVATTQTLQKRMLTMKTKYLLRDPYWDDNGLYNKSLLTEADLSNIKNGALVIAGKVSEAEVVNHNNRIYPKEILAREISKYQSLIRQRRSYGELDHPDRPIIEWKYVSHLFTDIWWEGNKVFAKIEILNDDRCPSGQILALLHDRNIPIGMSSRGMGSVEKIRSKNYVSEDYQLICWDSVTDPSTPNAFADKTISESMYQEYVKQNEEINTNIEVGKNINLLEELFSKNNKTSINCWRF